LFKKTIHHRQQNYFDNSNLYLLFFSDYLFFCYLSIFLTTIKKHKRPLTITYRQQAFCWRKKFRIIIFFNKYFATFVPAIARKVQTSKAAGKKFVVG